MTILKLNEEKVEPRKGFWRRQFQTEATEKQKVFDWVFGAILPVVCFVFDPIVFKDYGLGKGAELGQLKPFAYLLSFVLVMAMSARLIWGAKLKGLNAFLAGLFAVGAIISLGFGIILLPFSLLGLLVIIGALGFTPLFSSFVYLRNAFRSFQSAGSVFTRQSLIGAAVFSAILSFTIPMLLNLKIYRALEAMKSGDAKTIRAKAEELKYVAPLANFDALGGKYCQSPDGEEHQALAEVYQRFTGESIKRIDLHICEDG